MVGQKGRRMSVLYGGEESTYFLVGEALAQ
jgi:hypothetical protein